MSLSPLNFPIDGEDWAMIPMQVRDEETGRRMTLVDNDDGGVVLTGASEHGLPESQAPES